MEEKMMEEREESMVSPLGGNPILRTAHFLKPITQNPSPLLNNSKDLIFDVKETSSMVYFRGTTSPLDRWKEWVYKLIPKYQDIWKNAGIYDSILNSTYKVVRHNDLVLALAEKWNVETNTFVFPWGESTVTLEDMIVLGGYSVLGDSVSYSFSTDEMKRIEEKLMKLRKNIERGTGRFTSQLLWLDEFIDSDDEITHVAFLSLWLSRYVFSCGHGGIGNVFSVAIHLSFGTRLAIAPAVLAVLYRDLTLIKNTLVSPSKGSNLTENGVNFKTNIWAPFQLVQIWAWERFLTLRPRPNLIQVGEPRLARWHEQIPLKTDDLRKSLNLAGEDFEWRPYCMVVTNWRFNEFYRTSGDLVNVESGMDENIESFALCIRPSELVGLGGLIQQYSPHRVAMQFGYDQDIPAFVPRFNGSPDSAWEHFTRPIRDKNIYLPPRLFESDVTLRYFSWWGLTVTAKEEMIESNVEKAQSKTEIQVYKRRTKYKEDYDPLNDLTIQELLRLVQKPDVIGKGVVGEDKCSKRKNSENSSPLGLEISGARPLGLEINGANEDKKINRAGEDKEINGACEGKKIYGAHENVEMVADHMEAISFANENGNGRNSISSSEISYDAKEFPSWYEPLKRDMKLGDRISRLERLTAKLKAERFGRHV